MQLTFGDAAQWGMLKRRLREIFLSEMEQFAALKAMLALMSTPGSSAGGKRGGVTQVQHLLHGREEEIPGGKGVGNQAELRHIRAVFLIVEKPSKAASNQEQTRYEACTSVGLG